MNSAADDYSQRVSVRGAGARTTTVEESATSDRVFVGASLRQVPYRDRCRQSRSRGWRSGSEPRRPTTAHSEETSSTRGRSRSARIGSRAEPRSREPAMSNERGHAHGYALAHLGKYIQQRRGRFRRYPELRSEPGHWNRLAFWRSTTRPSRNNTAEPWWRDLQLVRGCQQLVLTSSGATNSTTIVNSTIAYNDGGTRSATGGGLLVGRGNYVGREFDRGVQHRRHSESQGRLRTVAAAVSRSLGHNLETGTDCGFTVARRPSRAPIRSSRSTSPQDNGGNTDTFGARPRAVPQSTPFPPHAPGCGGTDQRDLGRPQGSGVRHRRARGSSSRLRAPPFTAVVATAHAAHQHVPADHHRLGRRHVLAPERRTADPQRLVGTHTYAEEGIYTVTFVWTDSDGGSGKTSSSAMEGRRRAALQHWMPPVVATAGFTVGSGMSPPSPTPIPVELCPNTPPPLTGATAPPRAGTVTAGVGQQFVGSAGHAYLRARGAYTTLSSSPTGGVQRRRPWDRHRGRDPGAVITGAPPSSAATAPRSRGRSNPNDLATTAEFQSGWTRNTPAEARSCHRVHAAQTVGSDFSNHAVSASVAGLVSNAVYHVRLVATNSAGTTYGPESTFTTGRTHAATATELGKTFNVSSVSGDVLVKINGVFVPLTELPQIPKNTVIDALHGTLSLITAAGGPLRRPRRRRKGQEAQEGQDPEGHVRRRDLQAQPGHQRRRQGPGHAHPRRGRVQGRPHLRHLQEAQGRHASAAALSSKTLQLLHASAKGKFSTKRPLQRRHRPRHQMDDRRPLRRHPHPRHHRLRRGDRLRPPQDDHPPRRAELPGQAEEVKSAMKGWGGIVDLLVSSR